MKAGLKHFFVAAASFVLMQNAAYAGGCIIKEVTVAKDKMSEYMAILTRNKLYEINQIMSQRGQKLNAVLVARAGESLNGFSVVKDNPNIPLQQYMDALSAVAYKNANSVSTQGGRGVNRNRREVPRDLIEKERLVFSHFGILVRQTPDALPWDDENPRTKTGEWSYIVHLLADCDEKSKRYGDSSIWTQHFYEFFWDTKLIDLKNNAHKVLLVVPTPELQERLLRLVNDKQAREQLHEKRYNVAATPFRLRPYSKRKKPAPDYHQLTDQNSNQWPLEMIAAATRPFGEVLSRYRAQDVLFETNYRPSILDPRGLKESNACAFKRGPFGLWDATNLLNCNDQVFREVGLLHLITVDSVVNYMTRQNLLADHIYEPGKKGVYVIEGDMNYLKRLKGLEELDKLKKIMKRYDLEY